MVDTSPRSIWEIRLLVTPIRSAARADLRRALEAGEIVDAFIVPLAERRSRNGGPPWTLSFRCPRSAPGT
jgi:hypothetical protein